MSYAGHAGFYKFRALGSLKFFFEHSLEGYQLLTEQSGDVFPRIRSEVCCSAFQMLTVDPISDQK